MIGITDNKRHPVPESDVSALFLRTPLKATESATVADRIKAHYFPDDEVEIHFTKQHNRIQLTVVKAGKEFRVFEGYQASYQDNADMVGEIREALEKKSLVIQSYAG